MVAKKFSFDYLLSVVYVWDHRYNYKFMNKDKELNEIINSCEFMQMWDEETKEIEEAGWTRKELQEVAKFITSL